ncbi:MAG: MMPL family transporter [Candidatus Aminicenantes bacterium]|nr:MMPL family transporter [Candidatus Aminicenantes bacterium]
MKVFIERPIATAMLFLALLMLGIYSYLNIPIELAPKEEYPELNIITSWPGVPPEIIQTQISSYIEEKASTVKGVRKIESSSGNGRSVVTLEFDPKVNMEFAHLSLTEKIAEIEEELPEHVKPRIEPFVPEEFQVEPFLKYTISGDYSLHQLRKMVKEKIEMKIGSVKGISSVSVTGGAEPEIGITLIEDQLKALNIPPFLVSYRIQQRIRTYPAGKIEKGSQEFLFKVSDPITDIHDLGETIITRSGENIIRLKDIAEINPTYGEIRYINRINGQPTITLTIHKEKGTSTLKLVHKVKNKLQELKKELPSDLVFRTLNDESEEIQENLRDLYIVVAIIITVIFILVFLVLRNFKPSLLVISSVVFSILITFNLIYLFDISLNMLTLGGLALGIGLFVDNSIVVFENILRKREQGLSKKEAAVSGSKEVFLPVLAATLTTMSVFFAFAYFQGRLKIYYLPLAIVMTSALATSLLVSFSLIPALSPRLLKRGKKQKPKKSKKTCDKIFRFLIRHPLEVILVLAAIFYGTYKWFRSEVTIGEWMSWYSKQRLYVSITMPAGTDIEQTDEVVKSFEQKILTKNYEKKADTTLTPEHAQILISFPLEIETSYRPYVLKEELIQHATNYAGVGIGIYGFDPQSYHTSVSSYSYLGSRIKFFGYNLKKLNNITLNLERMLKKNPRIKDTQISSSRWGWRLESFEYILKISKDKIKKYNVDPEYLYFHIRSLIQGRVGTVPKAKISGQEMDISIKFPQSRSIELKDLQDMMFRTQEGEFFRLGDITEVEERPITGSIDREDQQFQQTLAWEFRGPYKAAENYRESVFNNLSLPPGFSATLEGTRWMTEEEKGQITFAIIFSIIIIFMILSSLYESLIQPFFILLAVPLALIGVFVAFIVADFAFDSAAYVGVILLGGIVVNNSILLVDHINLKRKKGLPLLEAVLQGTRERIRPIFLTTSTTVLGMLPMILIQVEVGRTKIWSTLALSAVGGLISSTLFILIAIPVFYYYGDHIKTWIKQKSMEIKEAWRQF